MSKRKTITAKKHRLTAMSVVAFSVLLAGCNTESEVLNAEPVIRPVFTEVVSSKQVSDLSFNGTIQSANRADLSFRQGGRLVELLVKEGDQVAKNQLIAKIDTVDAEIALASANNELVNAKAEYQRAKKLYETRQSISKSQFEELTLRFNLAQNQHSEAKRRLDDTNLRAPFSGVISRTFVDNHVLVQSNESIVSMHDLQELEAVIHVPESVMMRNTSAPNVFAQSPFSPYEKLRLSLKKYETEPDPVTRTYAVTFAVELSETTRLLPGMNVNVYSNSANAEQQSIQIPLTSIKPDNLGHHFVWLVDENDALSKRQVVVGALNGERVQIRSNLQIGEQVVVSGTQNLWEGLVVRPQLAEVK